MKYAGLTDDPERRRREHGVPVDWNQHAFETEEEAKSWEKAMVTRSNILGFYSVRMQKE